MLVRSASTPVLGALHPSRCHSPAASSPAVHFAESPTAAYHPPAISCHSLTSSEGNHTLVKGDYRRAEEYYSRAILSDPDDGELLPEYAKLVWDVHHDEERASSYFERAAKASPQDSSVLAAHAAFLWDTDDCDEPEGSSGDALGYAGFTPARSSLASATT
ncbi:uncharacterized protein LOC133913402 [Phragmites australis]|uniref:uncharacterized protein LOC133913402 n=1 Tax=Phragmites australis TaxID=29695 RepID=UPI002D76AB3E|nr:uncharacterized protein LOC133913402 [Phragmites australis]